MPDTPLSLLWDSTRLRLLVEIDRGGSVSAAAQAIGIGQPTELDALAGLHAGTIHIGASTTPGVYLLPDTLGCFRRDHPNVTVEVEIASTGEIIDRLLTGRVQLALVGETQADDRIALDPELPSEISRRHDADKRDGVIARADAALYEAERPAATASSAAGRSRPLEISATTVRGTFVACSVLVLGRVAMVQHQGVAVRVAEEGHVADARVQRVGHELDAA